MKELIQGIHQFQQDQFDKHKELFSHLAKGQQPQALFITCSDSRIDPNLVTQSNPGELFILRNAGNIIPTYDSSNSGEGATIEYALAVLNIEHIILCGHTHCGAISGLMNPDSIESLPLVKSWLSYAKRTKQLVDDNYAQLANEDQINIAIQENVLVQLENLKTYPIVAERLAQKKLRLHAWVYKFETGQIFAYNPEAKQFSPLTLEQAELTV